jgi:hypothetical protein
VSIDIARELALGAHGGGLSYHPADDGLNAFNLTLPSA